MTTITITDEGGQLTIAIDGAEPQPVQNVEDACQAIESAFGQPEQAQAQGMAEQDMMSGFQSVRGGGLNG